jgi:hypothetical protein
MYYWKASLIFLLLSFDWGYKVTEDIKTKLLSGLGITQGRQKDREDKFEKVWAFDALSDT